MLDLPLRTKKPTTWFTNSMSDPFHSDLTFEQIAAVFGVMAAAPHHTFQMLTKRPQRAAEWFRWLREESENDYPCTADEWSAYAAGELGDGGEESQTNAFWRLRERWTAAFATTPWPLSNVWLGVSVEDQAAADERIPLLQELPAAVRFLSVEPLLGSVDLLIAAFNGADSFGAMAGIDWVIVGGESGPGARVCSVEWIRGVVRQCEAAKVPVFVKQLGASPLVGQGHYQAKLQDRKGGDITEFPEDLRVREFPRGHEVTR
jgi:protein gp37